LRGGERLPVPDSRDPLRKGMGRKHSATPSAADLVERLDFR
jgi:hypothetical protein